MNPILHIIAQETAEVYMKKFVLSLFIPFLVLTSCGSPKTVFPDAENGFILEIGSNDDLLVLSVNKTDNGYSAKITEPGFLSSVSVLYSGSGLSLRFGNTELPFSEKTGSGLSVLFKVTDLFISEGVTAERLSFETEGYKVVIDSDPSPEHIGFTLTDGQTERSVVMRPAKNSKTLRDPESTG